MILIVICSQPIYFFFVFLYISDCNFWSFHLFCICQFLPWNYEAIVFVPYMICLCYCFNLYYIFISKKNRRMSMMCSIKSYIWVIGTPIFPLKKRSTPVFIIVFGLNLISFSCRLKMWPAHILTLFSRHFGDMLCDCWPLLYIL